MAFFKTSNAPKLAPDAPSSDLEEIYKDAAQTCQKCGRKMVAAAGDTVPVFACDKAGCPRKDK